MEPVDELELPENQNVATLLSPVPRALGPALTSAAGADLSERSLLVVPDSRGRVRNWHVLKQAGYWKALCKKKDEKLEKRQEEIENLKAELKKLS